MTSLVRHAWRARPMWIQKRPRFDAELGVPIGAAALARIDGLAAVSS